MGSIDTEPAPPDVVGAYRIVRRLGGGGMGSVYEAEEPSIRRRVAVKILRQRFADDPEFVDRFRNEARLANTVKHPAIVDVFAFGQLDDGRPYFVMPLLEGSSVKDVLVRETRLSLARSWEIARSVAAALSAAHAVGMVHRDLKPDNVFIELLGTEDRVRIMDFGIAKTVGRAAQADAGAPRTQTGLLLGTPAYMAPEQWWGARIDERVDQYALGVMLFEMVTGAPPFDPHHESGVMKLHLHEPPPSLAIRGVPVPRELQAFVARLLAKEPTERFETMASVIEAGDRAFATAGLEQAATANVSDAAAAAMVAEEARVRPFAIGRASGYRRWLAAHLVANLLTLALLGGVGYAGEARWAPKEWFVISGFTAYFVVGAYALAVATLPVVARVQRGAPRLRGLARALAVAPGALGALGTYSSWDVVARALSRFDSTQKFNVFNEGAYEAGANRFLGFGLAIGSCLSVAALAALSTPRGPAEPNRASKIILRALAVAVVALGALSVAAGAPGGALVAAAALAFIVAALALPMGSEHGPAEVERGVFGVLAVLFACGAALERISAREAILWQEQPTRDARIAEILAAASERAFTSGALVAIGLLVVAAISLRLRAVRSLSRPSLGHVVALGLLVLCLVLDVVSTRRFRALGESTRAALTDQFALFAELDPPSTDALDPKTFAPHQGPALQISRTVVAVNGREVSRLGAASSAAGRARVEDALFEALARSSEAPLSCLIDRGVPWTTARELLGIAHLAGATDAELLFTRGPAPHIPDAGPPEVTYVDAKDFVAVGVRLGSSGEELDGARTFGELGPGLVLRAKGGAKLAVGVGSSEKTAEP